MQVGYEVVTGVFHISNYGIMKVRAIVIILIALANTLLNSGTCDITLPQMHLSLSKICTTFGLGALQTIYFIY